MKLRRFAELKAYVKSYQGLTRPRGNPSAMCRGNVEVRNGPHTQQSPWRNPSAMCRGNVEASRVDAAYQKTCRGESLGYVPR